MNFEILRTAIPEESLSAFLEKNSRYDGRNFEQIREFTSTKNILEFCKYSLIGSLGLNKVILVLKIEDILNYNNNDIQFNFILDNFESTKQENNYLLNNYVNQITKNNIKPINERGKNKLYTLYITIESIDGNIYDTIGLSIQKFFEKGNEFNIELINDYTTNTICFIDDKILMDPSQNELDLTTFTFNVIKFVDNKYYINKIAGSFQKWNIIKNIIENLK